MAVNYIKQLTTVMQTFAVDDRLNPAHVSLYLALFQMWNLNRFQNPISINRTEAMRISKIGSRVTYHKCIKDLHNWQYLSYHPSHNPLKGSHVHMYIFGTSKKQVANQQVKQVLGSSTNSINNTKLNKPFVPPSQEEIEGFMKNNEEAQRFHNYYTANGWKVGNGEMQNWQAAAKNWLLKAKHFSKNTAQVQKQDNLHTSNTKPYDQAL